MINVTYYPATSATVKFAMQIPEMMRGAIGTLYSVGRTNIFVSNDSGFADMKLFENILVDFMRSRGVPIAWEFKSRQVSNLCARFRVSPQVDIYRVLLCCFTFLSQ
jgi:hypothetical protein